MSDIKLGQIITGEAARDAIHIAVAPVVAGGRLEPGQHVGLVNGKAVVVVDSTIGIVDPFLKQSVKPGEICWLFLYPNTIKGLRHEWQHPAFLEQEPAPASNQESVKWLEEFAAGINMTYDGLIEGCKHFLKTRNEIECPDMEWKKPPCGFWSHFTAATGAAVGDETESPFVCCI